MNNKYLTLGILAHVDSGKTTLSEAMLFQSGTLDKLGRVDHGDSFFDTNPLERSRGITIFSKQAIFSVNNTTFTMLDTPGHVDFSAEMERTLKVLDYAVLVISASDGVQSHTYTLWKLLEQYSIPTFIFVNKTDMDTALPADTIENNLKTKLHPNCINFSQKDETFFENIASCDECLLDEYFSTNTVTTENITRAIKSRKAFPCFYGSALKNHIVDVLLTDLQQYTSSLPTATDFGFTSFKITTDDKNNRLTHIKCTGGGIKVREEIAGEKITEIRLYSGEKFTVVQDISAGMVCAIVGPKNTYAGMVYNQKQLTETPPTLAPVLNYYVTGSCDQHTIYTKLKILEEEDPQLKVTWHQQLEEIQIQLMGQVQLEIIKDITKNRFNLDLDFGTGNILYKETITEPIACVGHFEPLRHYAEVHLLLEPTPPNTGITYATCCSEDTLAKNWQNLILSHLNEKSHPGVLTGSPITDIKITLLAGKAHLKHTESGDFREATFRALRQGLRKSATLQQVSLLEPVYSFTIELPTENLGRAMTDIEKYHGNVLTHEILDNTAILTGTAPVKTLQDYQLELNSYTKGKGSISTALHGYQPCHNTVEVIDQIDYKIEQDLANSADSIFCSHGAKYTVKWDEAEQYQHIENGLAKETAEPDYTPITTSRVLAYCGTLEQDAELLAIYERTYGKIKRSNTSAPFTPPPKAETYTHTNVEIQPEILLIDGYNILFAWDELKTLAADSLEFARGKLLDIVCNYQGIRGCQVIVVFDAYNVKGGLEHTEKYHNITVVYTKESQTADMYIEQTTHKKAKDFRIRVATSDNIERTITLGHGAIPVSAQNFQLEVKHAIQAMEEYLNR